MNPPIKAPQQVETAAVRIFPLNQTEALLREIDRVRVSSEENDSAIRVLLRLINPVKIL